MLRSKERYVKLHFFDFSPAGYEDTEESLMPYIDCRGCVAWNTCCAEESD